MSGDVIESKLESLLRCVRRIEGKLPLDAATLEADFDLQDVVVLNLTRAVQVCADVASRLLPIAGIPSTPGMKEAFVALQRNGVLTGHTAERMQKAVGFRNMAVHEYDSLNMDILAAIATKHLDDPGLCRRSAGLAGQTIDPFQENDI